MWDQNNSILISIETKINVLPTLAFIPTRNKIENVLLTTWIQLHY